LVDPGSYSDFKYNWCLKLFLNIVISTTDA
jgi:hypothetical protein